MDTECLRKNQAVNHTTNVSSLGCAAADMTILDGVQDLEAVMASFGLQ